MIPRIGAPTRALLSLDRVVPRVVAGACATLMLLAVSRNGAGAAPSRVLLSLPAAASGGRVFSTWHGCVEPDAWLAGEGHATRAERREYRRRAHAAWMSLGLSRDERMVLDAIAWRETRWDACAVHRLGRNEDGYGLGGNQWRFHLRHWGSDEPQDLRVAEVSALVMARVMLRSVRLYGVRTWRGVGRIYGGAGLMDRDPWRIERFCRLLAKRGVDCRDRAHVTDIGIKPQGWERRWLLARQWDRLAYSLRTWIGGLV